MVPGLDACSGSARVNKIAIPVEDVIRSYRLAAEGDQLLQEGKDHLALAKYLEASQLNPTNEVLFNKLAVAYSRIQMIPQAKAAVDRAVRLNPKYSYAYNTRGIVYLALQDYSKATQSFIKAIRMGPPVAVFYVNLGQAYMMSGKFSRVREAYQEALKLDPDVFKRASAVHLPYTVPENDSEKNYEMARVFAELGDKKNFLQYLDKALAEGFSDQRRLWKEAAFERFKTDAEFVALLGRYGMAPPTDS